MIIRPIRNGDLKKIDEIYQKHHGDRIQMPGLNNQITSAVVENENRIVGFGIVKAFAEAIMMLDLHEMRVNRVRAMDLLMLEAFRGCQEHRIEQVHAVVHTDNLEKILKKHYGYSDRIGKVLYREI